MFDISKFIKKKLSINNKEYDSILILDTLDSERAETFEFFEDTSIEFDKSTTICS